MRYGDKAHNEIMALLERRMKDFLRSDWGGMSEWERCFARMDNRSYDEERFVEYIRSLGGSLIEDPYPPPNDEIDDDEWDKYSERNLQEIEARTGMFPSYLPHSCGPYKGCLLPHDLVARILILGTFP